MANIIVLGTGLVGKAIALDLAKQHQVTALDINKQALDALSAQNSTIKTIQTDLSISKNITDNIHSADLAVSAVPGFMGFKTLETIICSNKNVVDIAFFPENALELDKLAKQHDVTAIVDMGVAPGLSNLILGYHSLDTDIDCFKCMVGGLPKYPKPPFNYKAPFSPIDVIEEYTRPARLVRKGKAITLPALSEIEFIDFENAGTLEAFNTDGLRTLINSFPGIPNMVEKTLRYPGHAQLMQTLIDIGLFDPKPISKAGATISPLELATDLLKKHWRLEENEPEFTVMSIQISGKDKKNPNNAVNHQYLLFDEYDSVSNISSMARTTGYTCTAAVKLVFENTISSTGVITPEFIGQQAGCYQQILRHYEERNIELIKQ